MSDQLKQTKKDNPKLKGAKLAVQAIIDDISDRAGIGDQWDSIDEDIQQEIRDEWEQIIKKALK